MDCFPEELDFFTDKESGRAWQIVSDSRRTRVSSVCRSKCVVHVHIGQASERLGEGGIVLLFFGMESNVFKQNNLARLQSVARSLDFWSDAVGEESNILIQKLRKAFGDGSKCEFWSDALRSAQVTTQHNRRALVQQILDGRKSLCDPPIIGDRAVL
jgi:hypothetical protein